MGTLAAVLAGKKIPTPEDRYVADAEGDIENVSGILKITRIRVNYRLKVAEGKMADAREAFATYLVRCPAAQSLVGCIDIRDTLQVEEAPS
jgi:organic hydroperoxide reductase OsmC/OhrA